MQETIYHAKYSSQPLLFFKLDFAKAYDKVDNLSFLYRAMTKIGILEEFINMIRLLFLGASACVNVNGINTRSFKIGEGVCHGCPLAPYLFLIVGKTLNIA